MSPTSTGWSNRLALAGIPTVKLNRFAAEARALNAARMNLVAEQKRHALVAALVFQQRARAYDDGAEMLIRQVRKIHNRAKERLQNTQAEKRGADYEPRADT